MIKEFFENTDIFITGGSGVVGKALIEKLLRSCNVHKIYILLRPKKDLSIEDRLRKIKNSTLFDQLKLQKPRELDEKLICVPGDCCLPSLGITDEFKKIMENVTIVFHSAATIRFDEPLKDAIKLNVGGTLETLKFAETLKHLKVFMHVSTFFSNPYLKRIEEKVYESPMDWKLCLNLLERNDLNGEQLDILTRKLIVGFPNTYCFTKNLTESMIKDLRYKFPIGIFRPSIVLFALEEPEPGFPTTLVGAMGLFALTAAGICKNAYIDKTTRLDMTPQDIGIKALCYYTYKTANLYANKNKIESLPVYILSSCTMCDLTFCQQIQIMEDFYLFHDAALEKNLLIPGLYRTDNRYIYMFLLFLTQILPALFVDFILILCRRKPILMSIQRRLYITLEVMKPFLFNSYDSAGVTDLLEMSQTLKGTEFNIDILSCTNNYFKNVEFGHAMIHSLRKHLLKEDPKTLPRSRKILQIKIFIYNVFKFLLAFKIYKKILEYLQNFSSEQQYSYGNSTICYDIK